MAGAVRQEKVDTTIITPNSSWIWENIVQIWNYRDLLFLTVRRDFVTRYRQTILGPAWTIIQPLITTLTFTIIFGKVARLPTDGLPPVLFYMAGLLGWTYFAQVYDQVSCTLAANQRLFSKVYFPRMIFPLATSVSKLINFAIQLGAFLGVYFWYVTFVDPNAAVSLTPYMVFIPLLLLQAAMIALGVGLLMSALTVKYRDLGHLSSFLIQLWMYGTPIIYPASRIPEKFHSVLWLNPMAMVTENFRHVLLGEGFFSLEYTLASAGFTVFLFFLGLYGFARIERTFVDIV